MKTAKRSVSDAELRRYEAYAQQLQASRGQFTNFRFSENDGSSGASGNAAAGSEAAFGQEEEDDLYS